MGTYNTVASIPLLSPGGRPLPHQSSPIEDHVVLEIVTESPDETREVGAIMARNAAPGHVYLLAGDLGAGKTCLTQGILRGLGGNEYARSPTFVLTAEYEARLRLYHFDLYRLESGAELLDLGIDEYVEAGGVCVVEWADRFRKWLPPDALDVSISSLGESGRRFVFSGPRTIYGGLMRKLSSTMSGAPT